MYQVTRIAENNVTVSRSRQAVTTSKAIVDVFVDPPESYGVDRLARELAALQAEKDRINSFDKDKELERLKDTEAMLKEIESALAVEDDKDDGATVKR